MNEDVGNEGNRTGSTAGRADSSPVVPKQIGNTPGYFRSDAEYSILTRYGNDTEVALADETSTQLLSDAPPPIPVEPGRPKREGYEYRQEGTRNLLLACEPLAGWRHVAVTERRTKVDFAHQMRWLADETYPEADVVRVVLDNLNTHRKASLYETFPA